VYGDGDEAQHEKAYFVGIPPCLWGSEAEGLLPPPVIRLDGSYRTKMRSNNTNGHWGTMALWQMHGSYLNE
jgi:hypothetical protein